MDTRYLAIPEKSRSGRRFNLEYRGNAPSDGVCHHVTRPVTRLLAEAHAAAASDTELLFGEEFTVHEMQDGWCFGRARGDHYLGWVEAAALAVGTSNATDQVITRGTFVYAEADLKSRPLMKLPMGARFSILDAVETRGTRYLQMSAGFLVAGHVGALADHAADFVSVSEQLSGLAYLWAGRSSFGLDCSGLVQLAMGMAGIAVLRDSDLQEATIGEPVALGDDLTGLQRGDLVFWPGHVGIMQDALRLIHANGHTMSVHSEPLHTAVERISYLYGLPRAVRRPFGLSAPPIP